MIKNFFILLLALCSYAVEAQILKIDKGSLDADSSGYFTGNLNVNFNMHNRSATAEKEITFVGLEGNADLVYVAKKHAYILINKINYFKSTGGPLLNTGYAHFRINFFRKKTLSYESFTQIQYDNGRMMPFRFLQGAGLRYRLASGKNAQASIGIGAMYEVEHWKALEDNTIEKEIWKTSNYINSKFTLNENVNFNLILYYQGGYDAESDLFRNRVSGDAVLTVGITGRLSFLTTFTAQHEDKPIIPINKFTYSLTNGLKWSF